MTELTPKELQLAKIIGDKIKELKDQKKRIKDQIKSEKGFCMQELLEDEVLSLDDRIDLLNWVLNELVKL
jgi:hypothetical protein